MTRRRWLAILLSVAMIISCMPAMVMAEDEPESGGYAYVDENGEQQTVETADAITSSTASLTTGWYIVDSDVSLSGLSVSGDVKLIVSDAKALTMNEPIECASGSVLTVYGQTDGTGKIMVGSGNSERVLINSSGDLNFFGGKIGSQSSSDGCHIYTSGDVVIARASVSVNCMREKKNKHSEDAIACANLTVKSGSLSANDDHGNAVHCTGEIKILDGVVSLTGSKDKEPAIQTEVLTIKGGEVTVSNKRGIAAHTISLSWSKSTDRIDLSGIGIHTVHLSSGGKISLERPFWIDGNHYLPSDSVGAETIARKILTPSHKAFFAGHSLTLEDGRIGMNFFVYEPSNEESTLSFSISGKGDVEQKSGYETRDAYRIYTCYISSIQMADTITAEYSCNGETLTDTYSVKDYLTYIDEHSEDFDTKTIDLVHAIADYGHYGQIYLKGRNGWTFDPDTGYAEMTTYYASSYDQSAISALLPDANISYSSGIVKITYQLYFDSAITLNIFFKVEEGASFTCDGAELQDDGRWKVTKTGISATDLDTGFTVTGTCNGAFSVSVSPLTYIKAILNGSSDSAKNAVSAFYKYYEAAKAYAGI